MLQRISPRLLPRSLALGLVLAFAPEAAAQRIVPARPHAPALEVGYHAPASRYIPSPARGYYRTERRRVWVPGRVERIWVEPVYSLRYEPCGSAIRVLVRSGHWKEIVHPGHYALRNVRVWVPSYGYGYGYGRSRARRYRH